MKPKLINALILIAINAVLSVSAAEADAVKKDMASLQGEWTMVSGSADGQSMPDEMRKQMKRVCKGDEVTTTMNGQVYLKAKITIDPTKKPKTIDYQMIEGPTKGQTQLGIYEIDGDKYKASFGAPGAPRPTELKGGEGLLFSEWQRTKKESTEPATK